MLWLSRFPFYLCKNPRPAGLGDGGEPVQGPTRVLGTKKTVYNGSIFLALVTHVIQP